VTTAGPPALGSRPQWGRWGRGARAVGLSTPFLAVVAALAAWPSINPLPSVGLDASWHVALQMATHRGLDWGTQIVFSYGPLGFLSVPETMYGGLTALSALYVVAVIVGFAAAFLCASRRAGFALGLAFVVAFAATYVANPDVVVPIALICCAIALGENPPRWAAALVVYGGGALCGVESLVKLNSGLAVAAIVLVTVAALPGRRAANLGKVAATALVTFAVLWFATGQGIGNFDDYIRTSFEIIGGYSSAMMAGLAPDWTIWAALALIAATLAASVVATRGLPRGRRIALVTGTALLAFAGWKEGFVRHDRGHMALFFVWMLAPWIGVVAARGGRWRWAGLAGFAGTLALYFGATAVPPGDRLNVVHNASNAVTQVHDLLDPGARGRERDGARLVDALTYRVDPKTLKLIGDRPIDVYPWNASLAWALGLNWDPQPVFQAYSAYTPALDEKNADALSSSGGPQLILRHLVSPGHGRSSSTFGLEGRYAPYDTPAATLAMICNFRPLRTTSRYQLLGRTRDRCGAPRPIGSVDADFGESVRVPEPRRADELVFARVHGLAPSGAERLWTLLYKAAFRYVVFDGDRSFHLVAANAGDGLVLRAPPGIDFPAPFAMAPQARRLAFDVQDTVASPSGPVGIDFYAMRVRPYTRRTAQGPSSPGRRPSAPSLSR
jgi:hypothetical protein